MVTHSYIVTLRSVLVAVLSVVVKKGKLASDVVQPPVQQVSYAAWVAFGELPTLHFGEEQLKHARVAQTAEQRTRNA